MVIVCLCASSAWSSVSLPLVVLDAVRAIGPSEGAVGPSEGLHLTDCLATPTHPEGLEGLDYRTIGHRPVLGLAMLSP